MPLTKAELKQAKLGRLHNELEIRTKTLCVEFRTKSEVRLDPTHEFYQRVRQLDRDARDQDERWWQAQLDKELRNWRSFPLYTVIHQLRRNGAQ